MANKLLKGKKGLIFGALNNSSIAWKIAERSFEEGAQIMLSNAPVAKRLGEIEDLAKICNTEVIYADATNVDDLEMLVTASMEKLGGKLDFVCHSIGMSPNVRKDIPYDNINYDYYLNSPYYQSLYRPFGSSAFAQRMKYFYDDILIIDVDSVLNLKWNTVIHKKQDDEEQDNFLSFGTFNAGGEIHFLFTANRKKQLINNHSVLPGGQVKRYATLKSFEAGYEFMPKLSRQVGARQVIIPCLYRGSVAFAKIDFSES